MTPKAETWAQFFRCPGRYLIRFTNLVDFSLSNDMSRVDIHPVPLVSQDAIDHLHQNLVLPLALSHLEKLILHASAVEIDNRAAVFLASSGAGKSTLAAYLASNGLPFLSDDGVELEESPCGYSVRPSHPSIRLWETSSDRKEMWKSGFHSMSASFGKTRFLAIDQELYCDQTTLLQNIYLLDPVHSSSISIGEVSGSDVVAALLQNSFLLDVQKRGSLTSHFKNLSHLATRTNCVRLSFPRDYYFLPQVRDQIVAHMHSTRAD